MFPSPRRSLSNTITSGQLSEQLLLVLLLVSITKSMTSQQSLRAGCDNCLRPVHVAVASLKFGLQFDGKPRKIDKIPSREFPRRVRRTRSGFARRMLKSNDEMHCVIAHFIRRLLRLEIKRAETAVTASGGVKLWI